MPSVSFIPVPYPRVSNGPTASSFMASLSEYERKRNLTIEENHKKLKELGLDSGNQLKAEKPAQRQSRKRKVKADSAQAPEPTRRSSRVRHAPAADVFVADEDEKSGRLMLGGTDAKATVAERQRALHPDELPIDTEDLRPGLEREVWQILREARNAKAKAMERSMFIVCNDRTLCEMVRTVPTQLHELYELFGMGEKKVNAHGKMLLEALAPHIDALHADHEAARQRFGALESGASGRVVD